MKKLFIVFMVVLMSGLAGCGSMRMPGSGDTSGGAMRGTGGAGSANDNDYRSFDRSPGERLLDPYDSWFSS